MVTSMRCVTCLGSGWVGEDHPDRPSDVVTEGGCDCGGAPVPCTCNPDAIFEGWLEVFASTDSDLVRWRVH